MTGLIQDMQINRDHLQTETYYSRPVNWVLFFGSVFFFVINLFASVSIFPSYSLAIGSSPFLAGLQNTAFSITAVLLRFFFGPIMDRQGPKPLMLLGVFAFATTPILLILSPTYPMLLAARIYQSIGLSVYLPGISTLAAEMAPQDKIGTYLGTTRIFINLGLLAGPSAALFVIGEFNYNSWFIINIVTCVISFLLLYAVNTPDVSHRARHVASSLSQITKALTEKQIYPVIGGIALYSFTYSAVVSFAAVHIESASPNSQAPYFFIVMGIAGVAGCLGAGALSDLLSRQKLAWPLLVTLSTGAIAFSFIYHSPALVIICAVILGLGIQGSSLVFAAWLIDLSKPELRATTMSLQENSIDIMFALGALVFGLAAQGPGLGSAFLTVGILTIAITLPLARISGNIIAGKNHREQRH